MRKRVARRSLDGVVAGGSKVQRLRRGTRPAGLRVDKVYFVALYERAGVVVVVIVVGQVAVSSMLITMLFFYTPVQPVCVLSVLDACGARAGKSSVSGLSLLQQRRTERVVGGDSSTHGPSRAGRLIGVSIHDDAFSFFLIAETFRMLGCFCMLYVLVCVPAYLCILAEASVKLVRGTISGL